MAFSIQFHVLSTVIDKGKAAKILERMKKISTFECLKNTQFVHSRMSSVARRENEREVFKKSCNLVIKHSRFVLQ